MKKALLITYDLQPPWDSGLKVFGRGLMGSLQRIEDLEIEAAHAFDNTTSKNNNYDYVHVVLTGLGPVSKAIKAFKDAIIFKHIVTPSITFRNALAVKMCYGLFTSIENRLTNCFSSNFVAKSYFMDGALIVPPSVDSSFFVEDDSISEEKIVSLLESATVKSGVANIKHRAEGLLLYSGPLTEDRFPYRRVLDALKDTNSNLLVVGRPANNGADADKVQKIVSYAEKIDVGNRLSVAIKVLREDEKVSLLSFGDVVIQPFANSTQAYVAVDPPVFLLEAMSCGKPVITSKTYSFQSLIRNGYNGYAIGWDDPNEFREALKGCLDSDSMGSNARQSILDNYSYDSVAKKIKTMYNDYN